MPNLDGTGPEGSGPATGNRMGNCGDKVKDAKAAEHPDEYSHEHEDGHKCCGHGHGHGKGHGHRHGHGRGHHGEGCCHEHEHEHESSEE